MAKYFQSNKISISGFYSRNYDSAVEAAKFTESEAFNSIRDLVKNSDIIFISTPDNEIYKVWMDVKKENIKHKILCHFSGTLSSEVFCDIHNSGGYAYSLHPMFPISDKYNSYKYMKEAVFSLEGSEEKLFVIEKLIKSLGNQVFIINKESKPLYHLANVLVSNLYIGLIEASLEYLEKCGINQEEALMALKPLIYENINNIYDKGISNALTGPIERGDDDTINKHLAVINKDHIEIYRGLSNILLNLAKNKNPYRDYGKLQGVLRKNHTLQGEMKDEKHGSHL